MTTESAYLENTPRACENCGEESPRRFTVECSNCEGDITVCGDCVNASPRHEECPEGDA